MSAERRRFTPGSVDYNGAISAHYSEGRALSSASAETWRAAIAPFVSPTVSVVLDLGCGTGRFLPMLSQLPVSRVIAIDPSRGMLSIAARDRVLPDAAYLCGSAEAIPLRDGTCDLAWLSQMFHHVRDRDRSAQELRRVLRSGERVLIRGTMADRLEGFPTLFRFFPGAREIARDVPTFSQTTEPLENHGFTLEFDAEIEQQTCASLREFATRSARRADSSLVLLSDAEFHAGMAVLEDAALNEREPIPVVERLSFLVFRRL